MYRKGEVRYQAVPLPDRVQKDDAEALGAATAFLDYMRKRHSVRDYSTRAVPEAVIAACIAAAGTAPSGANHQPWHFVAISDPAMKARIREGAEEEERTFYQGGAGDEWLAALVAQRYGMTEDGMRYKNYYVPESVGIATGILITAIHHAGLVCLEHTPNPMKFLGPLCGRPEHEKPVMILPVGYPSETATVPAVAKRKKPLDRIMSVFR
jgi:nitroreductase